MKKTLLLSVALGLAGAASLTAATVDVFLTGSTAFRANAYTAATKLYSSAPTIYYGSAANGGADSGFSSSTASWVMTGTPISQLTNLVGNTLVVHGLFTGSVQGIATVEAGTKLKFAAPSGTANGLCNAYITNAPTIGFSDASGSVTPFNPAANDCSEESVCVVPFVFAKSNGGGIMTNINNISYEQVVYGIDKGYIPYSSWTGKASDTNTFIYFAQRTLDSGTRRAETAIANYAYGDNVGIYLYDETNNVWFLPSNTGTFALGTTNGNVVGPVGLGGINGTYGAGYVGGGDLRDHALKPANAANLSIGFISFSDTKNTGLSGYSSTAGSNWASVVSFNGFWPTTNGVGIRGSTATNNDFAPITLGYYPLWSEEIIVYPTDIDNNAKHADHKISSTQLGSQADPGSFIGVFNYQTKVYGGSPLVGSIENEIELSKTGSGGQTAIRLSEMRANRQVVGGKIFPY